MTVGMVAAMLVWAAYPAVAVAAVDTGAEASDRVESDIIAAELNRMENVSDGCRLSFVIHNRTSYPFATLQWDLVFFDTDGLIASRMGVEAAPLPARKTSVKLYDLPGLACDRLGRVLLNDVIRCESTPGDHDPADCLQQTLPSSRTRIEFIK